MSLPVFLVGLPLLFARSALGQVPSVGCFVQGECVQSHSAAVNLTASPQECLQFCKVPNSTAYDFDIWYNHYTIPVLIKTSWQICPKETLSCNALTIHCLNFMHGHIFQETESCVQFTHYADSMACFAWDICLAFSPQSCTDCLSGDVACPLDTCSAPGICNGYQVKTFTSLTYGMLEMLACTIFFQVTK